ncbi:MAG TPA: hypothetical protein VK507_19120 [Iamia sp.]|nr:hypothetical protein [Iamia sp.]
MTHPFTPHPTDDECMTLLTADDLDNPSTVPDLCGRPRLSLVHAIPFDQHHDFDAGRQGVSSSCRAIVVEEGKVAFCSLSTRAQVHQPVEPEPRLFPGPEVDGRPTWFCQVADVPAGYQWRTADAYGWTTGSDGRSAAQWAQARRRLPVPGDQVWLSVDAKLFPVTFAELSETIVGAGPKESAIALAVWQLLTDGEVPSNG